MTEETVVSADPRDTLNLKYHEPVVSPDKPWQDDTLDRAEIAERLTNLIQHQQNPLVIGINGQWGTGKTFLLERWAKDLDKNGFSAIYYNAWEDDFSDDPLLSIIGQLSECIKEDLDEDINSQIVNAAVQLMERSALISLTQAMGVEVRVSDVTRNLLEEYREKNKTKVDLKKHLATMSTKVFESTNHPLIFIIDELDRCRPTFAIELLERVKHIFDVPNLVFILGINRGELCRSLQSVYGDIDANVYLRRFFDLEFTLPEIDSEEFCRSMMRKFELEEFFRHFGASTNGNQYSNDFRELAEGFPVLCSIFNFSLRDITYCVSLIALAGKNLKERQSLFPWLLSLFIPLKLKNPALFRQFIIGEKRASDIMNYLEEATSLPTSDPQFEDWLTVMESYLYMSEKQDTGPFGEPATLGQLKLLLEGAELTHPEILSNRTKRAGANKISWLIDLLGSEGRFRGGHRTLDHLAGLIDLHQLLRR